MGLFGRDNHPENAKTSNPPPPVRHQPASATTSSNITVIARPNRLEGTLLGSGNVRIEGQVNGTLDISGQLLVAENGLVEGKISASAVTVSGAVKGDISAAERIELNATARVEGNIVAPRILINDGATFDGQVLMKGPEQGDAKHPRQRITTSTARRSDDEKAADTSNATSE